MLRSNTCIRSIFGKLLFNPSPGSAVSWTAVLIYLMARSKGHGEDTSEQLIVQYYLCIFLQLTNKIGNYTKNLNLPKQTLCNWKGVRERDREDDKDCSHLSFHDDCNVLQLFLTETISLAHRCSPSAHTHTLTSPLSSAMHTYTQYNTTTAQRPDAFQFYSSVKQSWKDATWVFSLGYINHL